MTDRTDVWTYASATSVTVPTDLTATYYAGLKTKITQTIDKYFRIESSSYNAGSGLTTIILNGFGTYTVANAPITAHSDMVAENPVGFPLAFEGSGRSGGQTITGGTASGDDLTLRSTSNGTKGDIIIGISKYDEANNRLGIGRTPATYPLEVQGDIYSTGEFRGNLTGNVTGDLLCNTITIENQWGAILSKNPYSYAFLMLRPGAANTGAILDLVPHPTLAAGNATASLNLYLTDWSADQTNFEAMNVRAQDNEFGIIIDAHGTGQYRDFLINNSGYNIMAVRSTKMVELIADSYFDTNLRLNGKMGGQKSLIDFYEDTVLKASITRYGSVYGSGLNNIFDINQVSNADMRFLTNNTERLRIYSSGDIKLDNKLGIGGVPSNDLHVSKNVDGIVRAKIENTNTGTNSQAGLELVADSKSWIWFVYKPLGDQLNLFSSSDNVTRFQFQRSGNLYMDGNCSAASITERGPVKRALLSKTADYAILDTDTDFVIIGALGAHATLTLPTAADNTGRIITIVIDGDPGAFNVIVDGEGDERINGATTKTNSDQYSFIKVLCNGVGWNIVGSSGTWT